MIATTVGVLFLLASGVLFIIKLRQSYYYSAEHPGVSFSGSIVHKVRELLLEILTTVLFAIGLCLVVVQSVSVEAVFEICAFILIVRAVSKMSAQKR